MIHDNIIKTLVDAKYSIFNISKAKQPLNRQKQKMAEWQTKSYEELLKEHDYKSNLWGMRLGLHENQKRILSLDFDICGEKNKDTGERMGCPQTEAKLQEYWSF